MNRTLFVPCAVAALFAVAPSSEALGASFNKDFKNTTGQTIDDFEILVEGTPPLNWFYNGPMQLGGAWVPGTQFDPPAIMPIGGNTLVHWAGPNVSIPPGGIAHVGIGTSDPTLTILGVWFTKGGQPVGCGHQLTDGSGWHNTTNGTVIFKNTATHCHRKRYYFGKVKIEWHANEVALADLNAFTERNPIRVDDLTGANVLALEPDDEVPVAVPAPPPGANYAVLIKTIATDPDLDGDGVVVVDFSEVGVSDTVLAKRGRFNRRGVGLLASLALVCGGIPMILLRRRRTAAARA